MENKKVLVLGIGSIGSELVRQIYASNDVYVLDQNETNLFELADELKVWGRIGDIRDTSVFDDITDEWGYPDVIFHAAALKHVMPNELDPIEAVKTNILGTWNVIKYAKKAGADLINISTDKVVHIDCSIMGLTKKIAEKLVKNAGYISVRFGNVMNSRGSVYPIWERQLAQDKPITVTDKRMVRYMMSIPQACELILKAYEVGKPGQILIMDMGQPKNIYDLAMEFVAERKPGHPIEIIGIRPGELLNERLMTEEEEARSLKIDNFWII